MVARTFALLTLLAMAGCTRVGTPDPLPTPDPGGEAHPAPGDEAGGRDGRAGQPPRAGEGMLPSAEADGPGVSWPDPVTMGPWSERAEFLDRRAWYEELWTGRGRGNFERYLERMGAYEDMVLRELVARDLPPSLRYLPVIESGYNPTAVSWAGAVGLWQLMAGTARDAGLTVTAVVDERRDPYRATEVALNFLAELHGRFQSWPLALSAYNGGPGRVARLAQRHAPGLEYGDSVYFVIRPHLPRETRDFVPKLMAAVALASDPEGHGFADVQPMTPVSWEAVSVPDATSVDVLASAAEVEQEDVERLNPQLVRGFTPAGRETRVRLPAGSAATFATNYAMIPPEERVTFLEHRVVSGDTFWEIARAYGVPLAVLEAANPHTSARRLQIGQWLTVPRAPRPGQENRTAPASTRVATAAAGTGGTDTHVVRRGDTLWDIARAYGVGVGELRRWNGLGEGDVIRPGDRLTVRQ